MPLAALCFPGFLGAVSFALARGSRLFEVSGGQSYRVSWLFIVTLCYEIGYDVCRFAVDLFAESREDPLKEKDHHAMERVNR